MHTLGINFIIKNKNRLNKINLINLKKAYIQSAKFIIEVFMLLIIIFIIIHSLARKKIVHLNILKLNNKIFLISDLNK